MLGIDGVVKRLPSWAVGLINRKSEEKFHKLLLCGHGEEQIEGPAPGIAQAAGCILCSSRFQAYLANANLRWFDPISDT